MIARTGRRMGTAERLQRVEWAAGAWSGNEGSGSGAPAAARAAPGKLLIASSPVGIDGYCEWIETDPGVEVIARFQSPEPELDGRPAAARKRIGRGAVIRLAFWPADDSVVALFRTLAPDPESPFASSVPPGVEAVPRSDKSWFLINTTSRPQSVLLRHTAADRISGRGFQESVMLRGYEVLWLAGGGQ